ncbi:putative lipid II flippase FtsW [Williamsia phyllosphaerae]|uniref:Probable peptidoglycan glycosyltransferase FtsW n=1 Tax=Williamsia phyllosphaerae TaxID=885042 RepID=A0ABQ1UXI9_9NOCA|nr:putative lipid II flippase FtsW [Williamsia phyllosphaerae]GGF29515.1 cell division protein FtsW [Williamsia phyllosphaerae]
MSLTADAPEATAGTTKPTPRRAGSWWDGPRGIIDAVLRRPLASFHLIITLTVLLTVFGLIMVLSASSVEGYSKNGSAYGLFTTQVVFAVLGTILFYVALRMPVRYMRKLAAPAIIITTLMLVAVLIPGVGTLSGGARRWFVVAGLSVQPSELVKLALCVWGAHLLSSRIRDRASLRELLVPLIPVAILVCALIMLEPNLSTTITIAIIVGTLLWFAGLSLKVFGVFVISGISLAVLLAMVEGYRSERVQSFLGNINDPQGAGYQARQAQFALANGGTWGVGLGQSRAKWNYLPNAHNDFIFAIIGEELGLIGGLLVVALFVLLAFVGLRIALRAVDPFLRLMTATITILISAQALINIGYVIGLLPVTGIQLPLLSAGGTSTFTVLVMLGLLANAARHEPEAVAALAAGDDGRLGRFLRLPQPETYAPTRVQAWRARRDVGDGRSAPRKRPVADSSRAPRGNPASYFGFGGHPEPVRQPQQRSGRVRERTGPPHPRARYRTTPPDFATGEYDPRHDWRSDARRETHRAEPRRGAPSRSRR